MSNRRAVKSVKMHSVGHIDGFGQLGPVIDKKNSPKGLGGKIDIYKVDDGVELEILFVDRGVKKSIEAFIPNGNIVNLTFEPLQVQVAETTKEKGAKVVGKVAL